MTYLNSPAVTVEDVDRPKEVSQREGTTPLPHAVHVMRVTRQTPSVAATPVVLAPGTTPKYKQNIIEEIIPQILKGFSQLRHRSLWKG